MLKTITVAELIAILQDEDPDARVIFSTDYGDHCHTQQALPLRGRTCEVLVRESGYSTSGFALVDEDCERPRATDETFLVIE